jgi:predicted extracellular nuclease
MAPASFGNLIISEYVEGSSNNKAIELFNTGPTNINLATIGLSVFFNGSATGTGAVAVGEITGMLVPGGVFTIANPSWALGGTINHSETGLTFNGDDAVVLFHTSLTTANYLDVIGQIGTDPGTEWGSGVQSTADNTIRRNTNILTGDTNGANAFVPSTEWRGFAVDLHTLGTHDGQFVAVPEASAFLFGSLICGAAAVWKWRRRDALTGP